MIACSCDRTADTLAKLNDAEKKLKEQREAEYINLDISNEEREKGNQVCAQSGITPINHTTTTGMHTIVTRQACVTGHQRQRLMRCTGILGPLNGMLRDALSGSA